MDRFGKSHNLDDLKQHSVIIDETQYVSLEFLLAVKENWLMNGEAREKDINDIELMRNYLAKTPKDSSAR